MAAEAGSKRYGRVVAQTFFTSAHGPT
jgi:hypothetical protein